MGDALSTAAVRQSKSCRKSSRRSADESRSSWTAAFAVAQTSSKHWRWGAQAVCIGRPYLWGLGAFGQPGVERVLEILRNETRAVMQQVGAPSIKHLTPSMVQRA